jgi:hypothetical protein
VRIGETAERDAVRPRLEDWFGRLAWAPQASTRGFGIRETTMRGTFRSLTVAAWAGVLSAALVPASRTAAAAESPSLWHRDSAHKFSFKIFKEWAPVPVEGNQEREVCKFMEPGDRGRDNAQMVVFRLATGAAAKGAEVTGDEPKPPPGIPPEILERMRGKTPKSMLEVFNGELDGYGFKERLAAKGAKEIASKDDVPGTYWTLLAAHPYIQDPSLKYYMAFGAWKRDDVEYGFWLRCEGTQKKKYEQGFKQVVDSFTWHDGKAKEVATLEVLDGLPIPAKKRRQIERGLVRGWNVIVSPKKNYIVIYNTKKARNDLLARTIAKNIEAIREQIYEVQFPPAKKIEAISICRVCGDASEYHTYGGPGGSAGYWSAGDEELVFYDASPSRKIDDDTLAVLYHEAFHQYIFYSAGSAAPHSWFNEGHGDYYAGAKLTSGKFKIGPFRWRVGVVKNAIRAGPCTYEEKKDPSGGTSRKWDRSNHGYSPLAALVRMDQGEYYSYPDVSYAQGWSLVYFLREIVPKNPKWAAKWGRILPTYFDTLKAEIGKGRGEPTKPTAPPRKEPEPEEPDDPAPTTPGTGEPDGKGEPGGMGEPGGEEPPPPDDEAATFSIPRFMGESDDKALEKALDAAFSGVDFAELEKAWADSILKVPG